MKFKVGDRVKIPTMFEDLGENEVGLTGTIVSIHDRKHYPISVKMDHNSIIYVYNENHIKLLNSEIIKERLGIK